MRCRAYHGPVAGYKFVRRRFRVLGRTDGVQHLLVPRPHCERCFTPIKEEFAGWGLCRRCHEGSPIDGHVIERVVAATLFIPDAVDDRHSQEIIELKEQGHHSGEYAQVLSEVLLEELIVPAKHTVIIPVMQNTPRPVPAGPIALANALADVLNLPVKQVLVATREVRSQRGLRSGDRKINRENSMRSTEPLSGLAVYLVDDVLSTGSTMRDAARAVKEAGAVSAIGLVAGRNENIKSLLFSGVIEPTEAPDADFHGTQPGAG